ncbi:hypothetical protein [Methylocystis bryophila]|uniref:hypothetical protein n=1 Tax=Methylocystis bryophila TaxID=655015 RepID=UPI000A268934|nr:hypothetical protein [Methylocystis bryophila]BDV39116.1 hypothetical protein DSM21852_23690 [Methylocystis bryophila]
MAPMNAAGDTALPQAEAKRCEASNTTSAAGPAAEPRVANLSAALRRARLDNASRSEALSDIRGAEIVRLEVLRDAIGPVLDQLPDDCDLFDVAIAPSERPRLFIDQLGFVEIGLDRRVYRFLQDTRHGRIQVCESEKAEVMVEAVTAYIAHRLIEREKALACDFASGATAAEAARAAAMGAEAEAPAPNAEGQAAQGGRAMRTYLFLWEAIGAIVAFGLLAMLGRWFLLHG